MKILFFGTPQFSADILQYLIDQGIEIQAVITRPDKPKGRSSQPLPSPVKALALSQNPPLPCLQPDKVSTEEMYPVLGQFEADCFVVVAYGEILKQPILDMPRLGCINVHTSLLPKYRGAAPIQRAIIEGETETGVTIMHMVKKMDAGNIIRQGVVRIDEMMNYRELEQKLCDQAKELLLNVLSQLEQGTAPSHAQDETQVTFAPKIELEECQIDWNRPAIQLHNLIRGTFPEPGAWCRVVLKGVPKLLKVYRSKVIPNKKGPAGTIDPTEPKRLILFCQEDALEILELQLEGKKAMSAELFLRGINDRSLLHFF